MKNRHLATYKTVSNYASSPLVLNQAISVQFYVPEQSGSFYW